MTRAIPAIDSIVRASRDASRPPGCSPSRCRNALAGRLQRDEHRDDRADEHRRSTTIRRARLGRALLRKVAGPCLQRRVVHRHRGRLVGGRLGREPVQRGLQDRRSTRRGRARFRGRAVPTGSLEDLDRLNRKLELPTLRAATSYEPALPLVLERGATWSGTISARGALAGGLWVRLSFGPFSPVGEVPKGTQAPVDWITDHAYHLEEVAAVPA